MAEPTRNETLATLRHNLKNPLTAIALKIQMAQKFINLSGKNDERLHKSLELLSAAHKEVQDFAELIDQTFIDR